MTKLFEEVIENLPSQQTDSFRNNDIIVGSKRSKVKCHYVIDGYVKVYDLNANGSIKTIALLKKGDMFPLIWGFDRPPETVYYYKAMGPVRTITVDTDELKEKLDTNTAIAREVYMSFVHLAWEFMERIKCLQMSYTQEKILRLLPYLAAKLGTRKNNTEYVLNYGITQEEIAQLIGATRESVSAHLSKLEDRQVLSRTENRMTINLDRIPEEYVYELWFQE